MAARLAGRAIAGAGADPRADALSHALAMGRQARADPEPRHRRDRLRPADLGRIARGSRRQSFLSQQRHLALAHRCEWRGHQCAMREIAIALLVASVVALPLAHKRKSATASGGRRRLRKSPAGTSISAATDRTCRPAAAASRAAKPFSRAMRGLPRRRRARAASAIVWSAGRARSRRQNRCRPSAVIGPTRRPCSTISAARCRRTRRNP